MSESNVVQFPTAVIASDRLKSGGGGGTSGGMEARIAVLETKVDTLTGVVSAMDARLSGQNVALDARLRTVETGIATLNERVNHLPSKGFIVQASLGVVGALTTVIGAIAAVVSFSDQIKAWAGL